MLAIASPDIISFASAARLLTTAQDNERFRALFLATPQTIVTFDYECHITSWNPGAERVFGISESPVQRQACRK